MEEIEQRARSWSASSPTTAEPRPPISDDARNVTGTTLYVDSGYHSMGM